MKEQLNKLSKEELVDILDRVYDVHRKDVEFYAEKEDKLLYNIHKERVVRIERYVESALNRRVNGEKE